MSKKKTNKTKLGYSYVKILGHVYKIIETDKDEELISDRAVAFGRALFYDNLIYIDSRQSVQSMEQVLFHEIFHIIDWISHNESLRYDEETVNVLARGLATIKLEK